MGGGPMGGGPMGGGPMGGGPMGGGPMGGGPMGGNLMNMNAAPIAPSGGSSGFGSLDPLAMLNAPPVPSQGKGMQLGGVKKPAATKLSADDWDKW